MKIFRIYRRENVPCVSQTKIWKGFFEAHFMSGKEINDKYPIQNKLWKYNNCGYVKFQTMVCDGYYVAHYNDFHKINSSYNDPWYRELKHTTPLWENTEETVYHTTVESNAVILKFIKTKI